MKKIFQLLTISAIYLMSFNASAQEFVKGTKMLSFGIGAGDRYYGSGYSMVVPPLQANLDIGVSEKLGIGYIGVGGIISYSASRVGYGWWRGYERSYSNLTIGFRGTYHFALDVKGLDLYAGLIIGYNISSYKETYPLNYDKDFRYYGDYDRTFGGPKSGLFAGARYMFNDKFGVYGELGYSVSYLSVGVTFKF